jgi:hypothetical protein
MTRQFKRGVIPTIRNYLRAATRHPGRPLPAEVEAALRPLLGALADIYGVEVASILITSRFYGMANGVKYDSGDRIIVVDRSHDNYGRFPRTVPLLVAVATWLGKPNPHSWAYAVQRRCA